MFVVEPTASAEKLHELLREGHESSALDYKSTVHLDQSDAVVELTKDLAALRAEPLGGYIVIGADDNGKPTDGLKDDRLAKIFDEATLRSKVQKYLTEPLQLMSGVHEVDGHRYAVIYVGSAPRGFEILRVEGVSKGKTLFRPGDVCVRRGTASVRWNADEADERLERFAASRREDWRREMREDLREILSAGEAGRRVSQGPVDAFTWQLDADAFSAATVELLRTNDDIALRRFLLRAPGEIARMRAEDRDDDFDTILDRLTAIGALAVEFEREQWLSAAVDAFMRVYELGFDQNGVGRPEDPKNVALWLGVLSRAYGIGALAVRMRRWWAVSIIATPKPGVRDFETYWLSWIRHAQVQASRSGVLDKQTGIIALAHNEVRRLSVLRPDVVEDDDRVLASLCQFDMLSSVAIAAARKKIDSSSYYPNFAPYWTGRTAPAFELLVRDPDARRAIAGDLSAQDLAIVMMFISITASREAIMLGGFHGIEAEDVLRFLAQHLPQDFDREARGWNLG